MSPAAVRVRVSLSEPGQRASRCPYRQCWEGQSNGLRGTYRTNKPDGAFTPFGPRSVNHRRPVTWLRVIHSFVHSFMHACVHSFIRSSVHPSIRPSVHPSIRPSVHPSIRPFVHPSIRPSVHRSIRQSVNPSIRPSIHYIQHLLTHVVDMCYGQCVMDSQTNYVHC